jgi:hypothetical protein
MQILCPDFSRDGKCNKNNLQELSIFISNNVNISEIYHFAILKDKTLQNQ